MKREKFSPTYIDIKRSIILLFIVIIIYLYTSLRGFDLVSASVDMYIIKPLMWGALLLIVWKMPRVKAKAIKRFHKSISMWAFIFALIYVLLLIGVGMFMGLGKSSYAHDILTTCMNIYSFGLPILCIEIVRNYLIANSRDKHKWSVIIGVTLFMAFIKVDLSKYLELGELKSIAMFFGNDGMENMSTGLMASYLAYIGGAVPAIIYMGIVEGFEFLSPILPDLQWLVKALVSTIVPIFSFMIMQEIYSNESKDKNFKRENKKVKKESTVGWFATVVISVGVIWFSVGVFPMYPQAIASGSMEPEFYKGDMVIYKKIDEDTASTLKAGDIIHFKRENYYITHRILAVIEEDGIDVFKTKGDNNSVADVQLVKLGDVKGTYFKVIPKMGWPSVLLKEDDGVKKEDVEF